MTEMQKSVTFTGLTIIITVLFTLGSNVFAIEYTNNNYKIESEYLNIVYLDWINPSNEGNSMIIPVGGNFKDSNQQKLSSCAQSYMTMIPKIHRDDESYWDGSIVACAYGMYNYNINIGDKYNVDRFDVQMIEIEAEGCMIDEHCMKKINNIIKGKIPLQSQFSSPNLEDSKSSEDEFVPYTTTDKNKEGFIDREDDDEEKDDEEKDDEENDYKLKQKNGNNQEGMAGMPDQWLIEFCVKRVVNSNHLPSFCENKPELKEKIEIQVQKLQEKKGN